MKPIFSDDDRHRIDQLIDETEKRSNIQVVLAVIRKSDSYAELPWKAFALGATLAGLLVFALDLPVYDWVPRITTLSVAGMILAGGVIFSFLTILFPAFARIFLSADRADTEVNEYAKSLFLEREIFATSKRTGLLLLVSRFEREVVILPDKGLESHLSRECMEGVIASMVPLLKKQRIYDAFEAGLNGLAGILEGTVEGSGMDELPDDIIEEKGV